MIILFFIYGVHVSVLEKLSPVLINIPTLATSIVLFKSFLLIEELIVVKSYIILLFLYPAWEVFTLLFIDLLILFKLDKQYLFFTGLQSKPVRYESEVTSVFNGLT